MMTMKLVLLLLLVPRLFGVRKHLLARRAVQHLLGKATVAAGQHELEPGNQDVLADPWQSVALQDGNGALLPAGAEVTDGGRVLLVLGHVGGRGRQDAEVSDSLALGNEGEGAPVASEALLVAKGPGDSVLEEGGADRLQARHAHRAVR